MQIKASSKIISQLDLKFLDLKFLVLKSQAKTLPVRQVNHERHQSLLTQKKSNKNERSADQTADITMPHSKHDGEINQTSVFQGCTSDVLDNYLGTDLETIRNKCSIYYEQQQNSKRLQQQSLNELENKDVIPSNKNSIQKKKKNIKKEKRQTNNAIKLQIQKYRKKIKKIQEENTCIHKEIAKLYFQNQFQLASKVKNIKNLKIRGGDQDFNNISSTKRPSEKQKKQSVDFNQYMNDLEKRFTKNRSVLKAQVLSENRQKNSSSPKYTSSSSKADNNQEIRTSMFPKLKSLGAKSIQTSPSIMMKNKYQRFYEDLAEKKQKQPNQELQNLRKKMINNNIDKGFQSFLHQRRMRVPELFKKLR